MQALAQTNKHFYEIYTKINSNYADKVAFNTKHDKITEYQEQGKLKQVILNQYECDNSFEDFIRFCYAHPLLEKITIRGVINDSFDYAEIPYASLKYLTHIEISILIHNEKAIDYVLPLVESSHVLQSIVIENVILTRAAMMEISLSKNLKRLKMMNVSIFNTRAFYMLLQKMENIEEFYYIYHYFIAMSPVIKTLEAILDVTPSWEHTRILKISAWQAIGQETMRETRMFDRPYSHYILGKGNARSFFSVVLPLLSIKYATQMEIFYVNRDLPNTTGERGSIQYSIIDSIEKKVKTFRYTTN